MREANGSGTIIGTAGTEKARLAVTGVNTAGRPALEAGVGRFADADAVEQVRSRAAFGGITIDVDAALVALCEGRTSFKELEAAGLSARDAHADP